MAAFQQPIIVQSPDTKVHDIQQTTFSDEKVKLRVVKIKLQNIAIVCTYLDNNQKICTKYDALYKPASICSFPECFRKLWLLNVGTFCESVVCGNRPKSLRNYLDHKNELIKYMFVLPRQIPNINPNITFKQNYVLKINSKHNTACEFIKTDKTVFRDSGKDQCGICHEVISLRSAPMQNNKFICKACVSPNEIDQIAYNLAIYNCVRQFPIDSFIQYPDYLVSYTQNNQVYYASILTFIFTPTNGRPIDLYGYIL